MDDKFNFVSTYSYKIIYIFKIHDELHKGILKIGEATLNTNKLLTELIDNCNDLNNIQIQLVFKKICCIQL